MIVCNLVTRAAREKAQQPQVNQGDFYDGGNDMKTVDLEKDFNNSFSSFDIMEDDIQF